MDATMKTTSGSEIGWRNLPADLLLGEILSRLPAKSLLRFRCVSKAWRALVDYDADFARSHLNNLKNNRDETRLFVCQTPGDLPEFVVRPSDTFEPVSETLPCPAYHGYCGAISSLHGLILIKHRRETARQFGGLKLWNPSIRKSREIPALLKPQVESVRDRDIGLGYDVVAKSYKHVKLILANGTLHSVAIYSLGSDSWKIIEAEGSTNWHWDVNAFEKAVYFEGGLYFISLDVNKDKFWDLVRFDLSKEVFSSLVGVGMPNWRPSVGLLCDKSPGLVSFDAGGPSVVAFDYDRLNWYMWALDSESLCWTRRHVFDLEHQYLFHVKKNCDILTFWRSEWDNCRILEWSSGTSINHLRRSISVSPQLDFLYVSCYVESLVLNK